VAEYLKLTEVARRLDVSEKTARRYVKSGALPSVFIGGAYRVSEGDLEEFLDNAKVDPGKAPASSQPSFNGLLEEEQQQRRGILARGVADAADKWEATVSNPDASLYKISAAVDAALDLSDALAEQVEPSAAGYSTEQWTAIRLAARLLEISKVGNERVLGVGGEEEQYRARREQMRELTRRISA
jgi:excisionase family DNA binding protein